MNDKNPDALPRTWATKREQIIRRRANLELAITTFAMGTLFGLLVVQTAFGRLSEHPASSLLLGIFEIILALVWLASIINPDRLIPLIRFPLVGLLRVVGWLLFRALLWLAFIGSKVLMFGKSTTTRIAKQHPHVRPWADVSANRKTVFPSAASTWQKWDLNVERRERGRSNTMVLLADLYQRGGPIVMLVAIFLIFAALLFGFLQMSAIAPFIYTLF